MESKSTGLRASTHIGKFIAAVCFLGLMGCNEAGIDRRLFSEPPDKQGIIFDSCGPAGGEIVGIFLVDEPMQCGDSLDNLKFLSGFLDISNIADISSGMTLQDSHATSCDVGHTNCSSNRSLLLEIQSKSSGRFYGQYSYDNQGQLFSGHFQVTQCFVTQPIICI